MWRGCFRRGLAIFQIPQKKNSKKYGAEAGALRVGHSKKRARIEADEFDEEARNSRKNQVAAEDLPISLHGSFFGCSSRGPAPEKIGNQHPGNEFVDGRGINAAIGGPAVLHASLGRGDNSVGKGHAPRPMPGSGHAVVAVAGEKAADASDGVANGGGGRTGIEENEHGDFFAARENEKGGESTEESSKPGKSVAAEKLRPGIGEEFRRRLEDVIEARADDSGEAGDADDKEGVGAKIAAAEVGLKNVSSYEKSGGDHEAKGGDGQRAQVEEGDHLRLS